MLDRTHLGFIRSGAALAPAEKARMSEISERLAVLHTAFGQNVLHDEKAWHLPLTETDLDGLPDFLRAGAAQAAAERGIPGYAITLSRSLIEPFLTFSARRDLRRVAYEAWIARGTHPGAHDNRPLIPEILALRNERARLLGYPDFATFRLADSMAGSVEAAQGLLAEVWEPAKRRAAAERERLLELARAEGFDDALAPWDWRYYSEKVRRADYSLDEAELKSFFEFENIQRAAFDTAGRLFGLEFLRREDLPPTTPMYRPMRFGTRRAPSASSWQTLCARRQALRRLDEQLPRPGEHGGPGHADHREQQQLRQGQADAAELRRC
ncbi:M3 family metallopeptidase [Pseudoroseomonas wenyumeiae]